MKSIVAALIFSGLCYSTAAQTCTDESIHSLPGEWKMIQPVRSYDQGPADRAKEQAILKDMFQTIRSNFKWELKGGQIDYNYDNTNNSDSHLPFYLRSKVNAAQLYMMFRDFLCVRGRKDVNEASGSLQVYYNQLPFLYDNTFFITKEGQMDSDDPENNVYIFSRILPQFKNGIWRFFGGEKSGENAFAIDSTQLDSYEHIYCIVAKNNIAPLIPMTKAEYYENWIKKYKASANEFAAKVKEVYGSKDPNIDADTKKKMAAMYEGQKKIQEDFIAAIEKTRKRLSADQLAKPAFMREETGDYFEAPDFEQSHFYILKHNPAYYNTKLPKAALQLFSIDLYGGGNVLTYQFKQSDPRKAVDQHFFDEMQRINAIDLLVKKFQPLINN